MTTPTEAPRLAREHVADEELRKLAEAATPGEWRASDNHVMVGSRRLCAHVSAGESLGLGQAYEREKANAAFIAAANPTAILALLDERDAAFGMSRCECGANEACANLAKANSERDAALAKVAAQAQEIERLREAAARNGSAMDALATHQTSGGTHV